MKKKIIFQIIKNIVRMLLLITAASIVTFALMKASPIDPVKINLGQSTIGSLSQEQLEKLRAYWGVDGSPVKQYLSWAADFVKGDMGISLLYRQPVSAVILEKLGNSLILMIAAWLISGVLGFFLGGAAGMREGSLTDKVIRSYCLLVSSIPAFYLALLLLLVFGVFLRIFPIGLSVPIGMEAFEVSMADRIYYAVLPAAALSLTGIPNIALHTREKMIEILESDYILFARARGEKEWELFWRHGLRNALLPAVTLQFASISEVFGGSVLIEQVFSYPGLGQAIVTAALGSDLPLLMAAVVISAVLVFGGNTLADILYGLIDPRIRRGGRKG